MKRLPLSDWLRILIPILFLVGLNVQPGNVQMQANLAAARLAERAGQGHLAAIKLRDVLSDQPWRTALWERLGLNELAQGHFDEGDQALSTAQSLGILSVQGMMTLGESYQKQGKQAEALQVWQALALKDTSAAILGNLAALQQAVGKDEDAVQTLKTWRLHDPQSADAAYRLGLLLVASHPDVALQQLNDAASLDERYQPAVNEIQKAKGLAGLNADGGYQLTVYGRALANLGAWDLAETAFQTATNLSPEYAEGWAFLGEARFHNGKSGIEALNQAVKINPKSVLARTMLALYWSRQENWAEAIPQMQIAASIEPERAAWQMELGNLTAREGNLNAALAFYKKAAELEPNNLQSWQGLANFCLSYHIAVRETGLPAARQAVAMQEGNVASLDLMGMLLLDLGDTPGAERFLSQASEADENSALVQLHLGQLYMQTKDDKSALDHLVRAQFLDEKGQIGLIAQRILQRYFGKDGG